MPSARHAVVLVCSSLAYGGADLLVVELGRELRRRGWDVCLVSITTLGLPTERLDGLPVVTLEVGSIADVPEAVSRLRLLVEGADVVHSHMFHANLLSRLAVRAARGATPLINTVHSTNEGGRVRDVAYRLTNRWADAITAVGASVARARQPVAFPEQSMQVVNNAVRVPEQPRDLPKDLHLVSVGRFVKSKAFDKLIDAIRILRDEGLDATCTLVGDGPTRARIEDRIRVHQLTDAVHITGMVDDVSPYLRRARIYTQPSLWEGMPVAVLEALAHGIPIVVTSVGDMPQLSSRSGWAVPSPATAAALGEVLRRALTASDDELMRLGHIGRQQILENYSLDAYATRWERMYQDLRRAQT